MARTPRAERHHLLSKTQVEQIEPGLRVDRLVGGATYFDGSGDDARLTLENALDAAYHGAAIANGVVIEELTLRRAATSMLAARDRESGEPFTIKARKVVNAAGPWVDWIRRMDNRNCAPLVRLTKGVHLVVAAARLPVRNALVLTERAGRIVFVMPNDDYVLIGTTDTDFRRDAGRAAVDADDIEYLLGVVDEALPDFGLAQEDVVASFAGVRALPVGAPGVAPSAVAREEVIEESPAGLLTIAGGKLTTHRAIAERVLDRLSGAFRISRKSSPTRVTPLPGARPGPSVTAELTALPALVRDHLQRRYGSRAAIVARLAGEHSQWAAPLVEGASALRAEVIFAARYEMARSVGDFIVRRTAMTWREPHAVGEATRMVGRLMAAELGWDAHREELEIERARALANPAPNQ
jgi:glycerol-3-phosphate dehydrogenase